MQSMRLVNAMLCLQERALVTYVKRAYFPFVLREPQLRSAGGRVASAVWAYADPATAVRICLE